MVIIADKNRSYEHDNLCNEYLIMIEFKAATFPWEMRKFA